MPAETREQMRVGAQVFEYLGAKHNVEESELPRRIEIDVFERVGYIDKFIARAKSFRV